MANPVLSLRSVSKSYAGAHALDDVSIDLFAGEVHGLVGENGAGKSTLIKILSGAVVPDKGRLWLEGSELGWLSPASALDHGISTVYQDVDLIDTLSVSDNVFLGVERLTAWGTVDSVRQVRETRELLARLKVDLDPTALVSQLSPTHQQILQIVKALHRMAKVVILDEPTASLGHEESQALMEIVRQLTSEGIAVIYISHHLDEVLHLSDRVTVLKDGRQVSTYLRSETDAHCLVRDMVGRPASQYYVKPRLALGEVRLRVEGLRSAAHSAPISFEAKTGEILGFGGLVGSGRTELMETLFGARRRLSGRVFLDNRAITARTPRQAIEQGFCLLNEDRKLQALFAVRSVVENVAIVRNELSHPWLKGERSAVQDMVQGLGIKLQNVDQPVTSLSGGNQQKSVLARWLLSEAEVFIFDEPTKGVDVGAKEEIYGFMGELCRQGKVLLMVSSDLPELLSMSDRIVVMRNGAMQGILPAAELDEAKLMAAFFGLEEAAW